MARTHLLLRSNAGLLTNRFVSFSDAVHQKTIQSIYEADIAMSAARADLERAKASKEDRNKVILLANQVAAALLAPSRQVVQLLAGHGVLFPPCKQVSKALSVRVSTSFFISDSRSHTHHTLFCLDAVKGRSWQARE